MRSNIEVIKDLTYKALLSGQIKYTNSRSGETEEIEYQFNPRFIEVTGDIKRLQQECQEYYDVNGQHPNTIYWQLPD